MGGIGATPVLYFFYKPLILQKLQKNYDALLQLYGEKAEEAEELKLDLLDVKAMYRSQVMN